MPGIVISIVPDDDLVLPVARTSAYTVVTRFKPSIYMELLLEAMLFLSQVYLIIYMCNMISMKFSS